MEYVVRKSIKRHGKTTVGNARKLLILPGARVQSGEFPPEEEAFLINAGALVPAEEEQPARLPARVGRFRHDPAALAGKTIEQLRVIAMETDPRLDDAELLVMDVPSLVRLLTADFVPGQARQDGVTDRSRPSDEKLAAAKKRAAGG